MATNMNEAIARLRMKQLDRYDRHIMWLHKHPDCIEESWNRWDPLFARAGSIPRGISGDETCGCLTQVRAGEYGYKAQTPELTRAIRADHRIPKRVGDIRLDRLDPLREWQRRLDEIYPGR